MKVKLIMRCLVSFIGNKGKIDFWWSFLGEMNHSQDMNAINPTPPTEKLLIIAPLLQG